MDSKPVTGTISPDAIAVAAGVKRMTLEAIITRADGTVEHLGVIADSGDLSEDTPSPDLTAS